ncbi:MAG TPA: serine--tRNA ligase [Pseudolabrys sp.]|jgi:seryl-tRNA synthetase|nr:serine--tRNA ligase [Pseudolabrys sp.]
MYDIKWIREHPDAFDRGLKRRGLEPLSKKLVALDEKRRAAITKFEQAQARRNAASKEVGDAKKAKDETKASKLMAEVTELKTSLPAMEEEQKALAAELDKVLAQIPNTPLDDVPDGVDASGNVEHHMYGKKRDYAFKPKQHFELGEALGQMDFELAAKLSGARFVVLQKGLARLERALGQFMLDVHTGKEHGYTEVNPPLLVRDEVMFGTAQLPKFKDDQFPTKIEERVSPDEFYVTGSDTPGQLSVHFKGARQQELERRFEGKVFLQPTTLHQDGTISGVTPIVESTLWLIPTAEVPLTNLLRDSIVDESSLPQRYTACTPCFRAEAGAAGKDTRGMIRQHQFTKVELVSITTPERSGEEHDRMLACAEEVLKKLELHYRVVTLCTGDMGFAAQKTYDIEVWLPGQNAYREISSCSVCGEFQARRMNARYRSKDGVRHVHTLNGSGVAVGRALIAVMETYQQENGLIAVPSALTPYMGGITRIERA